MERNGRVPVFFAVSPVANRYREIGLFYDERYETRPNPWKDLAGRGPDFINYMTPLIESCSPRRYLEVGCGEGFLVSSVSTPEKCGLDI